MEEKPRDRAQDKEYRYHPEEEDRSPLSHGTGVKHEQSGNFQRQHQETQAKKSGFKKVNRGDKEAEKNSHLSETFGMSHPTNNNGTGHVASIIVRHKSTQKLPATVPRGSSKGLDHKKNMDLKNDKEKALNLNHHEAQTLDKKNSVVIQNGVASCVLITNGYSNKDNDGSGSEGGYTTPKKRKARCNNSKNADNVTKDKERDMHLGNTAQDSGTFNVDATEKGGPSRHDCFKSAHKAEAQSAARRIAVSDAPVGEPQRKGSDGKTVGNFGKKNEERQRAKLSSPSKEDSWTLFKPPPVFPVDNSSAKIVPKISYASKVKENLNKVAQGGGEALPPPVRLSQVPMSAMKTITSSSFTNGPVSGNGNSCLSMGTFFTPAASSIPPEPMIPIDDNVASSLESNCSSATSPVDGEVYEPRKCTLLIYPINMQPVLPSARHLDPPPAQTNQKALGDIFQNQWGLSFINEPNLVLDGGDGNVSAEFETTAGAPQTECLAVAATTAQPCFNVSPSFLESGTFVQDKEKRTCASFNVSKTCFPTFVMSEEENLLQLCGKEKTKVEAEGPGSAVQASGKDGGAKLVPSTPLFGASKEPSHSKDIVRRSSWGSFDVKAAVTYHTIEMESIFNLQKQDPLRVVIYDGTKDGPDQ